MIVDIFITTKNRPDLLRQTLLSFRENTPRNQFRLTVVRDGDYTVTRTVLDEFTDIVDFVLTSTENRGLGPSINAALSHIGSLKMWEGTLQNPLTCYVQDDVIFQNGWLAKLSSKYMQLAPALNLGFASGHSAIEHKDDPRAQTKILNSEMYTNKYIRATCMLADHTYWMSMFPIPRIDPETGQERGRPHNGLGSGVDWHFVRVHPQSVCRTGKTNLIIPGLVVHNGFRDSTWLERELPESEEDKKILNVPDRSLDRYFK